MTYISKPINPVITIHTFSENSLSDAIRFATSGTQSNSTAWPTANMALYIPFTLNQTITVQKFFTANGTATGNNVDIGLYAQDGTRLVSAGSTAQSGTSTIQYYSVTPLTIGPGAYYLALAVNGASSTFVAHTAGSSRNFKAVGVYEQTSAFALPATATFATTTRTFVPLIGLSTLP